MGDKEIVQPSGEHAEKPPHEPPRITRLGTIQELTLGGTEALTDGLFGGSVLH